MFDVAVIGGGVVGGLVLRELTKYKLNVCLLEKESDVAMGASKANSGIVHAGFDAPTGSNKAKFNVLGNKMMESVTAELGVKFRRNGSLVVAFSEEDIKTLATLRARGEENGVEGLEIIDGARLREMEKNISDAALAALYAPTGGIVCPYELTIAAIGNAMDNGAELFTDFAVKKIGKENGGYVLIAENGREVKAKAVINCAGLYSGKIAEMIGDNDINVSARKGEYILLDRECGDFVSHTLFFTPTPKGKGVLITQTVDGNILIGPTASEQADGNTETSADGLSFVMEKAMQICKKPPFSNIITSFAGVRAYSDRHDFIIEKSKKTKGFIHCAGIESPGLTASPAIAEYVVKTLVGSLLALERNESFNGTRMPDGYFKDLPIEEKNKIIERDPSYGKIVCRCERITEGEILRSLRVNPPATDIDGVKRRTRSGMGRCQGGFCQPHIAELIAKERGVTLTEVMKNGEGSNLLVGVTK
ncbi:MAG: NAD(P)/FAD-dependent oxidoreductase [Clostridia bacterium]|nr:NAD(P)/FAD-dependent oxidoreductase [Clostridia bacterium]